MSFERPRIDPALLAGVSAGAPARLARALDKDPQLAERWRWERASDGTVQVFSESGETVVLAPDAEGRLAGAAQIRCSCLLAPRCLHLLAVLTRLELAEASPLAPAPAVAGGARDPDEATPPTAAQGQAARSLALCVAELLEVGAAAAGVRLQADLARAIHECRCTALPRAASAGARVVRGVRELRESRPEFSLGSYADDLLELCEVTRVIAQAAGAQAPVAQAWVGVSRREYAERGNLRLHGLFCEPVLAGSGASGVLTHLTDAEGRLYTVADVQPGEPGRARASYERGVRLGETALSHRELCREGLFVQGATTSLDGRLGSGVSVRAVRAETCRWDAEPIQRHFSEPIAAQLERAYSSLDLPFADRPAGSTLLFLRGRVLAASGPALLVDLDDEGLPVVRCLPAYDHAELGVQATLTLLARAPGLSLRLIGRPRFEEPRSLALLAIAPEAGGEIALELPPSWGGRCNLGLDALQASHLRGLLSRPVQVSEGGPQRVDALGPLRRRWQRLALGGRPTLPPEASSAVEREARWLEERMLRTAAVVLRGLLAGALSGERSLSGERRRGDPEELARVYLAAGLYQRACARAIEEQSWLG